MKRIKHDYWTDGEKFYSGNPKDGFKEINEPHVKFLDVDTDDSTKIVDVEALNLKQPKNTIMDDIRKAQDKKPPKKD